MNTKATGAVERSVTLDISLLGRDYKVACKPGEESELREAVALVDRRMREIRDGSRNASPERVAVMAALNLAHDLQRAPGAPAATSGTAASSPLVDAAAARRRIAGMRAAIDQLLPGQEKLL